MPNIDLAPSDLRLIEGVYGLSLPGLPDTGEGWHVYAATPTARGVELPFTVTVGLELTEGRGQVPGCTFGIGKYDKDEFDNYYAVELLTEVQVTYQGIVMFWGPVVRLNAASADPLIKYASVGCWWYLGKRLVGGAQPWSRSWLRNPQFDDGLDRWTTTGTVVLDAVDFETGTRAVAIDGGTITQRFTFGLDLGPVVMIAQARIKLDPLDPPVGGFVSIRLPGIRHTGDSFRSMPVELSGPDDDGWRTVTVAATFQAVNPGQAPVSIEISVGDTSGHIQFDTAKATIAPSGWLAPIVKRVQPDRVISLGNALLEVVGGSAGGLNMSVAVDPGTPFIVDEWSQHPDRFASEVARLFTDRDDPIEVSVELTPTTRTVRGWYPSKGHSFEPAELTLRFHAGEGSPGSGNLYSYALSQSAEKARSEMNYIDESGVWGTYRDGAAWGGLLLQDAAQAPTGTSVADLPGKAMAAINGDPGLVEALTVSSRATQFVLGPRWGDRVTVVIDDGAVQRSGVWRVESRRIKASDLDVEITLNPWVEP